MLLLSMNTCSIPLPLTPMQVHTVTPYKALIFDLGGVLYNISYVATSRAFQSLGWNDFDAFYSQAAQSGWFDDLETGRISPEAFIQRVQIKLGTHLPPSEIIQAWNAILLELPLHRVEWLEQLSKHKPLYLLSNTNEIHLEAIAKADTDGRWNRLLNCFQKAYFSCRVGMRKPDTEIFSHVLAENRLAPSEVLFVEDSEQHIRSANALGMHTLWLKPPQEVSKIIQY
jgi:putative hydrolase of the HAD superfamily